MSSITPSSENQLALPFPTATRSTKPNQHIHAFDQVRAIGVLLVIALHCGMPYITHKMQLLVWPLHDANPSPIVDAVIWWIECFIMPLFLVLSGFVTDRLLTRKGPREFFQNRKRKLLYPLLLGCLFVLPFDLYIWTWGLIVEGGHPMRVLRTLKFHDPLIDKNLWGLSHLWYLQYIFLYGCAWAVLHRNDASWMKSVPNSLKASKALLGIMLAVGVATLYWAPEVVLGFQHRPWPVPSKFLYSGLFFFGGAWLNRQGNPLHRLKEWGPVALCCSVVCFTGTLPLIHQGISGSLAGTDRFLLALMIVGTAFFTCIGVMGCCVKWMNFRIPALSYIAAASFWMYLIHHPVVGASQIVLAKTDWDALTKAVLSWASVTSFTLITYELAVRKTRINVWLGGTISKPQTSATQAAPADAEKALPPSKAA